MMGPMESDFMDTFAAWLKVWRPDLMDKISMADVREIWEEAEELFEEAEAREPIQPRTRRPSSPQPPPEPSQR